MTSSSDHSRRSLGAGPAIFGLLLAGIALCWPSLLRAEKSVMQRGNLTIPGPEAVQDVVVADGDLVINGRVEGSVFVVQGDVLVNRGGVVKGNVTVVAGSLWVSAGAAVEGEINVFSGQVHVGEGAKVGPEVRVVEKVPALTPEKLELISRYVIFSRQVPPDGFALSDLSRLDLSALKLRKVNEQRAVRLDLFELGSMPLNLEEVADSFELFYRGHEVRVRVAGIRLNTLSALEALWGRLRRKFEEKTLNSVHNSLGEGAHWFFRHRGASYCLWYNRNTLIAVMVRHDDDDPGRREWQRVEDLRDRVILSLFELFSRPATAGENKP